MSNEGISPPNRIRAFLRQAWDTISKPDMAITERGQVMRARLLSALSLFLFTTNLLGIIFTALTFGPQKAFNESFLALVVLGIVSLLAYVFSRTPYINIGSTVFTVGISISAYMLAFTSQGSISIVLYTTLLPALVIGAALLSSTGLIVLILSNALIISIMPFYLPAYTNGQSLADIGNFITIGFMLWLLVFARNIIERNKLAELQKVNTDLHILQTNLEQRVEERTAEFALATQAAQKRSNELQAITEISQTIALVQDMDELLPLIVNLIGERFNFYHVGIFMLDHTRENALLKAANSKGGQRMLARKHSLKLSGNTSLIGFAIQTGRARIAVDVVSDTNYPDNPDLPDTHSEVVLPLRVGERVSGALDIQSTQVAAFNEHELDILTILADQVAITLQNARLYNETQVALSEARKTHGKNLLTTSRSVTGFTYTAEGNVQPAPAIPADEINKTASDQTLILDAASGTSIPTLHVPVKLRDQMIGVLNIQSNDPSRNWSEDEIALAQAISERAAFALENSHLFESATRRAEQEETIARVSERISASTDFDRILQTTIQELGRSLNASRTYIQLGTLTEDVTLRASED